MNKAQALQAYIQAAPPFDWQKNNCCQFAGAWAAPGALDDVAAALPTMPERAKQVPQALRRLGARSLAQAVTQRVGQPIPVAFAQPGDIVLKDRTLGLCVGRCFVLQTLQGLLSLPMTEADSAWRAVR